MYEVTWMGEVVATFDTWEEAWSFTDKTPLAVDDTTALWYDAFQEARHD